MIELILKIYFGINLFFAGYYLAEQFKWQNTPLEKTKCISWCILTMFFGVPYITLSVIWVFVIFVFTKIDGIFQIVFWFHFYFTKNYNNLEKSALRNINLISSKKSSKTIKGRIYKYCTGLINKKNNYVYVEPSEPQF